MSPQRAGALSGVLAAALMLAAMVVLRFATAVLSLPEVLAEWLTSVIPPPLFSLVLDTLKYAAKPFLLVCIALGALAVGALLGSLWANRGATRTGVVWLAAGAWLVTELLALPVLGVGVFGAEARGGGFGFSLILAVEFAAFGAALLYLYPAVAHLGRLEAEPSSLQVSDVPGLLTRREAVQRLGIGAAGLVVAGGAWRFLDAGSAPPPSPSPSGLALSPVASPASATALSPELSAELFNARGLSSEITSNKDFYTVSKNFINPTVSPSNWSLSVGGAVANSYTLTYEDLKQLPSISVYHTLECISNEIGGDLIGNAHWTGVRLVDLLERAKVQSGTLDLRLRAADGYEESFPIEVGMRPDTVLAYEMNGEILPKEHGFPARLLVPSIFGMKNVKWITSIEAVPEDIKGYWQKRGWSDVATYQTHSRIDMPTRTTPLTLDEATIGGIAFAGDRGIAAVEVSTDGGDTWQPAVVKPGLSPNSWVLWVYQWRPQQAQRYGLVVRATDGKGEVQTSQIADTLPDGATGYHRVNVNVAPTA